MSDDHDPRKRWYRPLIFIGGVPLLVAMLVDSIAVVGRHLRMPLNGSIEIVQHALLIAGATAMVVATLTRSHALVRLLIDRLPTRPASWCRRTNDILSATYFLALAAGGIWLAIELAPGFEQSELLGLPYRPLRVLANFAVLLVALIFLRRAYRGNKS